MNRQKWDLQDVKRMWAERAETIEEDSAVTHPDRHQRELEIAMLMGHIRKSDLRVGRGVRQQVDYSKACEENCGSIVGWIIATP